MGLIRSHLALECVAGWAGVWGGGQLEVLSPVQAAEHTGTNNPPHPHTSPACSSHESDVTASTEVLTILLTNLRGGQILGLAWLKSLAEVVHR